MKLPVFIIWLLPKKWQTKHIKKHWDSFSDKDVIAAYEDDTKWIEALNGLYGDSQSDIRDKFQNHLNDLVLPQMKQRNLL